MGDIVNFTGKKKDKVESQTELRIAMMRCLQRLDPFLKEDAKEKGKKIGTFKWYFRPQEDLSDVLEDIQEYDQFVILAVKYKP